MQELEEHLAKDSHNSHLPPSSNRFVRQSKSLRKKSGQNNPWKFAASHIEHNSFRELFMKKMRDEEKRSMRDEPV